MTQLNWKFFFSHLEQKFKKNMKDEESHVVDLEYTAMEDYPPKLTPFAACFNFLVMMVGTSIVAAPHVFGLTTPYLGIAIQIIIGLLAWLSAICILRSSCICRATSFSDLGARIFKNGPFDKCLSTLLITCPLSIVLLGGLASYIVIGSNIMALYIPLPNYMIKILLCIIITLMGSINTFEKMKFISYFAFCSILVIIVLILVVTFTIHDDVHFEPLPFSFSNFLQGIPIIALGFNGHMGLPGMSYELSKSGQSKLYNYLFSTIIIVIICNCSVGLFPSIVFGKMVQDDIVKQLAQTYLYLFNKKSILVIIVQIFLGCTIVSKSPLMIYPLKEMILERNGYTVRDYNFFFNLMGSFVVTLISGLIAAFIPDLSATLNTVATVGSLLTTGITAGIVSIRTEHGKVPVLRAYFTLITGVILLAVNFYTIAMEYM